MRSVAVDLKIVDPTAASYVEKATEAQGTTAATAAKNKITKHDRRVQKLDHKFYPMAVESYGHVDAAVYRALRHVSSNICVALRNHYVDDMLSILSASVQAGNARMLDSALSITRRAAQ
jgi:hypothetical protein